MPFILEGLVSTTGVDGSPHLAPMGPEVDAAMRQLVLKPFATSTTFANLKRTGRGVFHVTDDVEQLARSAIGAAEPAPRWIEDSPATGDWILAGACRWYAFRVVAIDDSRERVRMQAEVTVSGRLRDFCGFNRRSTPSWKRQSWPPASACCPTPKSLLNLNGWVRWSKRPVVPPSSAPGRSSTAIFPPALADESPHPRRLGIFPYVVPRDPRLCCQPLAFRPDVVRHFRRAAVRRRGRDGRCPRAGAPASPGRTALGPRAAGRARSAGGPGICRQSKLRRRQIGAGRRAGLPDRNRIGTARARRLGNRHPTGIGRCRRPGGLVGR